MPNIKKIPEVPLVSHVFGEPYHRYIQCPHCCEQVFLPKGAFRDQQFTHEACKGQFLVYWNAQICVRS